MSLGTALYFAEKSATTEWICCCSRIGGDWAKAIEPANTKTGRHHGRTRILDPLVLKSFKTSKLAVLKISLVKEPSMTHYGALL